MTASSGSRLATLVREHLLAGHLIDRAGMPLILRHVDRAEMAQIAIEEWRGASPVYTRRMQRLLGFEGDDVTTIFKGMQFDIGAPPQFLDFRYLVHDRDHGEFWLDHCGALADVEPMGDEFVHAMCHTIEDPTFPATACATNPRAVVSPIHRPPRVPTDRHPNCHWRVDISDDHVAAPEPTEAVRLATTEAARLPLAVPDPHGQGEGALRYDGPLQADVDLEAFHLGVLRAIDDEVCLQHHLLAISFLAASASRLGRADLIAVGRGQLAGVGAVAAERIRDAVGAGTDLAGIADVLHQHPALRPAAYVDARVSDAGDRLRVELHDCPALHESVAPSWPELLCEGDAAPLEAIAQGVTAHARVHGVPADGAVAAWEITLADEPAPERSEVAITKFSTGAAFTFETRVTLRTR